MNVFMSTSRPRHAFPVAHAILSSIWFRPNAASSPPSCPRPRPYTIALWSPRRLAVRHLRTPRVGCLQAKRDGERRGRAPGGLERGCPARGAAPHPQARRPGYTCDRVLCIHHVFCLRCEDDGRCASVLAADPKQNDAVRCKVVALLQMSKYAEALAILRASPDYGPDGAFIEVI